MSLKSNKAEPTVEDCKCALTKKEWTTVVDRCRAMKMLTASGRPSIRGLRKLYEEDPKLKQKVLNFASQKEDSSEESSNIDEEETQDDEDLTEPMEQISETEDDDGGDQNKAVTVFKSAGLVKHGKTDLKRPLSSGGRAAPLLDSIIPTVVQTRANYPVEYQNFARVHGATSALLQTINDAVSVAEWEAQRKNKK
jgi:hypothetical protein